MAQNVYTHADSIKGSITFERSWWDLRHYELHVAFNPNDSSINGKNKIRYTVLKSHNVLQLDLIQPMILDSVVQDGKRNDWKKDGSAYFINLSSVQDTATEKELTAYFHGKPHAAILPPWKGGVIWARDNNKFPWISVACQGMSASIWFPNKDHQYDEVDSASLFFTAPDDLISVSNGRLESKQNNSNHTATYNWVVKNPINNYNIVPYIGRYVNFKDTILGKGGLLDLDYWVLEDNLAKAKQQFKQVKTMLHCFEDWFGEYPFYKDSYKLVEAPFLGMEHQSAIAYGNKFQNGYKGKDLSMTGWGLKWDFIIVHESVHEWFANSITAKDLADNWIHEGFTSYAENLYTEYLFGKKAGSEYVIGTRFSILNDMPVIGDYNVNHNGSLDMYYKAANMLHTIRQVIDNDSLWKAMLRQINKEFRHQTVTTKMVEDFLSTFLKTDLRKVFDQYLRTVKIPVLEYRMMKKNLSFRWTNCVDGFNMPLKYVTDKGDKWLRPTTMWQTVAFKDLAFIPVEDFYIKVKNIK